MDCPRCGEPLTVYTLGGRRSLGCDSCGYIGVEVDHHVERRADETWAEALERFEREQREGDGAADEPTPAIVPVDED